MEIGPKTLEFSSPFTQQSTQYVILRNNSSARYAYKVKTTAPKLYFVRPNASIIEPGESAEVSVLLQPFKEEPAPGTTCSDKFLVLAIPISDTTEIENFSKFWLETEKNSKDSIESKKIRVRYNISTFTETPSDSAAVAPSSPRSPGSPLFQENDSSSPAVLSSTSEKLAPAAPISDVVHNGSKSSHLRAVSAVSQLHSDQAEDSNLQEALKRAQAKIRALSEELEDQKSIAPSSDKGSAASSIRSDITTATRQQPAGLPVSQTAILVLIAFLVGWIFF